eukprot:CAMPEP_0178613746 /NCGR_PEP_ID=MMETSP0698-20121128/1806_1 /TAXON_ID=265572 /ORGANISM="Extubocellulus spinifer, Strain CCMP396" /LENGTH=684 /DNA_ID=CAMNT_0020252457 /DNA_START=28 /DNA_END=2082 /DNA_ORIENTATION=+
MTTLDNTDGGETAILSFFRAFIEGGWWWHLYGIILLTVQLLVVGNLAIPNAYSSSSDNNGSGLMTVMAVGRGCALANGVAFWSFRRQLPGLIGSNGLTPAASLIEGTKRKLTRRPSSMRSVTAQVVGAGATGGTIATRVTGSLLRSAPNETQTWKQWFDNFLQFPTVFWAVGSSDRALLGVCTSGIVLSSLLFLVPLVLCSKNICSKSAWWHLVYTIIETLAWWTCGFLYLSLIHVSGDFLGLQSDSNLVEIDALLGLVRLVQTTHPYPALLAVRFFAFRKMLGCGICKWYGSGMWQKLTAMNVHYFTQPLPNRFSYFAHHMPNWFHRQSVLATFCIEVLLPYLIWADLLWPPTSIWKVLSVIRYVAWLGFNCLNFAINVSGNYGFIGFLNTCENLSLTDDRLWIALLSVLGLGKSEIQTSVIAGEEMGKGALISMFVMTAGSLFRLAVGIVIITYLAVSSLPTLSRASRGSFTANDFVSTLPFENYPEVKDMFRSASQKVDILYSRQRKLRLCNYQGKFAGMHDYRWEPIIEGSRDGEIWHQYKWKYKLNAGPDECGRVLPFHLPRLDWRVWFLPLSARRGGTPPGWYFDLLDDLQKQTPEVVALIHEDPFGEGGSAEGTPGPPNYIRSRLVEFTFAPKRSNEWWNTKDLQGRSTPMDIVVVGPGVGTSSDDDSNDVGHEKEE